jgi:hypothetical protein
MWLIENKPLGGRDEIGATVYSTRLKHCQYNYAQSRGQKFSAIEKKAPPETPATLLCFILELLFTPRDRSNTPQCKELL